MEKEQIKEYMQSMPVPMCVLDEIGDVIAGSPRMAEVFLYDGLTGSNVYVLTGIKYQDVVTRYERNDSMKFNSNGKYFRVQVGALPGSPLYLTLTFTDVTEFENLKFKYVNEKPYTIVVDVDNFTELMHRTEDANRQALSGEIDRRVRLWASQMNASVTQIRNGRYLLMAEKKYVDEQERSKFNVLNDMREIPTEADFPVTVSIGIGADGEDMSQDEKFARQALDMAKGRGGDQVVIKLNDSLTYYGGTAKSVEKRSKGKSRVIGYALESLIDSASNVLIMGHKNPDMDAFGSALGVYCLARQRGKRAYIVVDKITEALNLLYHQIVEEGKHEVITSERALEVLDDKSVLIMVDTHRPSISECPTLWEQAVRTVIIDHHRKSEEHTKTPTLSYMESYASSASELVTEILQYTVERRDIMKSEANALLAGIMVDTNSFSVKSGIRTFEAAAWLKRIGADSEEVKRLFQINYDMFKLKADCYNAAVIDDNGMAFTVYNGATENAQIINAQVADELLTIQGVKASFVASRDLMGRTYISARSLGEINVQVIMEQFGGGGHLNTAGAQLRMSPEEAIEQIKEYLAKEGLE
ncbi:MAG: DHH family phosphoesterase [Firmicutes bacterium]|nr:DHH family phosphoesterase [Bacillota bacterium]